MHVVVAEDDPLAAFNTERALRASPDVAKVTVVADGLEAYELLTHGEFSAKRVVLLTDLSMPRMSGLELATAIRAHPTLKDLPIVILTTSDAEADRAAAGVLGVSGYYLKSRTKPLHDFLSWLRVHRPRRVTSPMW